MQRPFDAEPLFAAQPVDRGIVVSRSVWSRIRKRMWFDPIVMLVGAPQSVATRNATRIRGDPATRRTMRTKAVGR